MGVRLPGRTMLGQIVLVAFNYDCVRTVKSYDITVLTGGEKKEKERKEGRIGLGG